MGESRTELLAWLNDLLQINYNKVEQAGTGSAYCQIMDSIYGDVAMNKVKFDTRQEYEFVGNYKVLQNTFDKHKIDKIIPVDKLMKCRFQDNLEFMQWVKRFWDQNFPGGAYNAVARRKGGPNLGGASRNTATAGRGSSASRTTTGTRGSSATVGTSGRSASRAAASGRTSAGVDNRSASVIMELNKQIAELKLTVDGLEKERDFYFNKLREIEILVQDQVDAADAEQVEDQEVVVLKEIQTILYSTEDGFEVPPENELEEHEIYDEDETF
ncbi:microtubule binding protein [Halteromyces radiatus]|uniref:microtubule binding protein n=1 Tax=Halteromyces radiatus TaxID=101107 RepID=UPI00221F1ACF|nr:microtubule binding protein [Halteromyces radiatus]KAI8099974.1 microtubule binding protein [Halteromyces radiatus]